MSLSASELRSLGAACWIACASFNDDETRAYYERLRKRCMALADDLGPVECTHGIRLGEDCEACVELSAFEADWRATNGDEL